MNSTINNPVPFDDIDLQTLYDKSPTGIIVFKHDGTIRFCNNTLSSWLGWHAAENICGKSFFNLLQVSAKLYFQMFVLPLLQMQGNVSEISLDIHSAPNSNFSCLFFANMIPSGEGQLIHATIVKISDRKKYEAQLLREKQIASEAKKRMEFLANTVANLLFTINAAGVINFVNERIYQCFNITHEAIEHFVLSRFVHPEDVAYVSRLWKVCFKRLKVLNVEARLINSQNGYEWFIINVVPYINESGKATVWFGSCTNINEQKEKQRVMINKLNHHITAASQIIAKHTASFREIAFYQSHVVRMPLANILGLINLMEGTDMNENCKELFSLLRNSVRQLDNTVKDIVNKTYTD